MKFAIAFANTGPFVDSAAATEMAQAAEAAGFESVWTVEHVVVPSGYESEYPYSPTGEMPGGEDLPIPDPLVWLTYVAAVTTELRLGTGVLILPQRNPLVLAKETATLDVMSGGRLMLGVGIGWLAEEFAALGVPFEGRVARTEEYVEALRTLWSQDKASLGGEFTDFADCIMRPQPPGGSVPIHVGGHVEAAARRAGRIGDGFFPATGSHEELARLFAIARETAAEHGRDPDAIEFTVGANAFGPAIVDEVAALSEIGVTRAVVPSFFFYQNTAEALAAFGEEIIAKC